MNKRYYNFSLLLNCVFIVAAVLLMVKFNVFGKLFNYPDGGGSLNGNENIITHSALFSSMENSISKVKGSDNLFELPAPNLRGKISLEETLQNRRSRRDFKDIALTASQVSQMLWAAYGITKPLKTPDFVRGGLKTAPSAGARYPLDIYLVVGKVKGLEAGVYKYIPAGHKLIKLMNGDIRNKLHEACWYQEMIAKAPITIAYTAIFERCTIKYGNRGRERYVCMDVGHSGENVYLQAEALGLGTCAVGAFEDDEVSKVLKLQEKEEILYLMPVGHYK